MKIRLHISYDGSHFFGWQKTRSGPSIEETLEQAISVILGCTVQLDAASRTDRGVHALNQVVSVTCKETTIEMPRLIRALNGLLSRKSIAVHSAAIVPMDFHPTLQAHLKKYHYYICNCPVQNPIHRLYSWHIHEPLDWDAMKKASFQLLGTHDFSSFTNEKTTDTERHITNIDFIPLSDGRFCIATTGNRFLYKMVRILVGTLAHVGRKKLSYSEIPDILAARDRKKSGVTAPAHGLFLVEVFYSSL